MSKHIEQLLDKYNSIDLHYREKIGSGSKRVITYKDAEDAIQAYLKNTPFAGGYYVIDDKGAIMPCSKEFHDLCEKTGITEKNQLKDKKEKP